MFKHPVHALRAHVKGFYTSTCALSACREPLHALKEHVEGCKMKFIFFFGKSKMKFIKMEFIKIILKKKS